MKIKLKDGSVFSASGKYEQAIKIKAETSRNFIKEIPNIINKHWKARTFPTKFGFDEEWDFEFKPKKQIEIAEEVLYPYLRCIFMGMCLKDMKSDMKIAAMQPDGSVIKYPKDIKKITH